ncbi:MAG: carboxypeptidase-like regulatory domain-containing protein [Pseudomonadota bacterium]|uniref:carboxypeptidase-like regulatory domain-containing protein n=1 Tax=Alcanivorax sp. TaxID=1872427 RepID=UPI00243A6FCF|nr:carboxypeptidase-like regulatory domain-containing protein [Alcanivorax sp.]MED5238442.1 carboxypeptidase-like regulatory domain-containing protein [Pseudomonadota bacterium]MEE3319613.1 carboxypeptidase-like regulatory domain-containing protein [Pseudomonadota bacterium]
MMELKNHRLAMVAALAGITLSGCKLTDLTDSDSDDDDMTAATLLQGTVTESSGSPAVGATVDIKDAHGDAKRLTTDSAGRFVWNDEFEEGDTDATDPFFGLKAPVLIRATVNGAENTEYYSVLCNTVYASGNRVNANALTHYTMDQTTAISADLFDNWDNWELAPQNNYCNQSFAENLTEIAGTLDGFNFFNSLIPSDSLPTAVQDGLDELAHNGNIGISTGLNDVEDSLGSLFAGYFVTWTLDYDGTIDGQAATGSEPYPMSQPITVQQLKDQIVTLVADEAGSARVGSLSIKALNGTRLGDDGTVITASLAGNVEALGQSKDFDLTLTFTANAMPF